MSTNTVLIIAGSALFVVGIAKLSSGQDSGFNLNNYGFNIFSVSSQSIAMRDAAAHAPKTDWIGLASAAIGLVSAGIGLTAAIFDWLRA